MKKYYNKIFMFIMKVIFASIVWSLFNYLFGKSFNFISNMIDVLIVLFICYLLDYVYYKFLNK